MRFEWEEAYVSVIFATDWPSLPLRIAAVESEIADRQLMLLADHSGTLANIRRVKTKDHTSEEKGDPRHNLETRPIMPFRGDVSPSPDAECSAGFSDSTG